MCRDRLGRLHFVVVVGLCCGHMGLTQTISCSNKRLSRAARCVLAVSLLGSAVLMVPGSAVAQSQAGNTTNVNLRSLNVYAGLVPQRTFNQFTRVWDPPLTETLGLPTPVCRFARGHSGDASRLASPFNGSFHRNHRWYKVNTLSATEEVTLEMRKDDWRSFVMVFASNGKQLVDADDNRGFQVDLGAVGNSTTINIIVYVTTNRKPLRRANPNFALDHSNNANAAVMTDALATSLNKHYILHLTRAATKSSDANLSALRLNLPLIQDDNNDGDTDSTDGNGNLDSGEDTEGFDPSKLKYVQEVHTDWDDVWVHYATADHCAATVSYPSHTDLSSIAENGKKTIEVEVTAENGTTEKTYEVAITKKADGLSPIGGV